VARQLQSRDPGMLAYVMIPRRIPGTDSAYLGPACRPFETLAEPDRAKEGNSLYPIYRSLRRLVSGRSPIAGNYQEFDQMRDGTSIKRV
jgi:hypothetical protein